jgi:sestrin
MSDLPRVDSLKFPDLQQLLEDIFLISGRVSHMEQVISALPSFFPAFIKAFNLIMRLDGPLPVPWRHYLAVLASARFKCEYFTTIHGVEFLASGGNPKWLEGIEYAPKKIQNILDLNAFLAHQPWKLSTALIENLVEGSDSWSLSELVHAILILTTFHAFCGFVFGLGITPEVDLVQNYHSKKKIEEFEFVESDTSLKKKDDEATRALTKLLVTGSPSGDVPTDLATQVDCGDDLNDDSVHSVESNDSSKSDSSVCIHPLLSVPPALEYEDFFSKSREHHTFRLETYNWKDHGYSVISRYFFEAGKLLDEEWDLIYDLTEFNINTEVDVDTSPFRRAIWNYAHLVYGMVSDSYDYQVNLYLNKQLKKFIKKVACHPQSISRKDFQQMGLELQPHEKVHVALLAVEGRRHVCLLYALHALTTYRK